MAAADGRTFAVRGADGLLAVHHSGGDIFAITEWLAGDGDARDYHDRKLGEGIVCDPSGCIGRLGDGRLVAYDTAPDALEEDCRRAILVVTTLDAPANFDRPWAPAWVRPTQAAEAGSAVAQPSRTPPRDATPKPEDIEADQ